MDPVQANLSAQRVRQTYGGGTLQAVRSSTPTGSGVAGKRSGDALAVSATSEQRLSDDLASGVVGQAQTAKVDHSTYGSNHSCPYC